MPAKTDIIWRIRKPRLFAAATSNAPASRRDTMRLARATSELREVAAPRREAPWRRVRSRRGKSRRGRCRIDEGAPYRRLARASELVARHVRLDPYPVEQRWSARRHAAEAGPDAAEYETERGEGSAGPALGQYNHGGAAALGRARQPKRRAQRERSRMAANIETRSITTRPKPLAPKTISAANSTGLIPAFADRPLSQT